eukprot:TRINITY_DN4509_c0_g1_i1.p1 TRINITY_DN4509_c0_g1~~TRINITY_DN4509_c0_g1_i1.p1  ORF type:complete len:292 (+),score=50.37 TRINITY_DN4509_c0_g1_i1:57-932(+)
MCIRDRVSTQSTWGDVKKGLAIPLAEVWPYEKKFCISCVSPSKTLETRLWLIINQPRQLIKGDVCRFGKTFYKVITLRNSCFKKDSSKQISQIQALENDSRDSICRCCYSDRYSIDDPLLSLCKCTGSSKYIHFNCIKTWLNYQMTSKKDKDCSTYYWKSFECELCQEKYPLVQKLNGRKFWLVDLEKPLGNSCLILESNFQSARYAKTVHVISSSSSNYSLKIGRSTDANIIIDDQTVSKYHAFISYSQNGFTLEDNKSKYGTLVLLPDQQELTIGKATNIQINLSLIHI